MTILFTTCARFGTWEFPDFSPLAASGFLLNDLLCSLARSAVEKPAKNSIPFNQGYAHHTLLEICLQEFSLNSYWIHISTSLLCRTEHKVVKLEVRCILSYIVSFCQTPEFFLSLSFFLSFPGLLNFQPWPTRTQENMTFPRALDKSQHVNAYLLPRKLKGKFWILHGNKRGSDLFFLTPDST